MQQTNADHHTNAVLIVAASASAVRCWRCWRCCCCLLLATLIASKFQSSSLNGRLFLHNNLTPTLDYNVNYSFFYLIG